MSDNKKIQAFHMGPEGLKELDPAKQGTGADRRKFMKTGKPQTPVAHAYLPGSEPEESVMASGGVKKHMLDIDPTKLYNITKDPEGHLAQAQKDMPTGNYQGAPIDFQDLARTRIKEKGYHGLHRESGAGAGGSVELFHKHPLYEAPPKEATDIHEQVPASEFYKKISEVRQHPDPLYKANITEYQPQDYAGMKNYLHPDKKSGFAIKPDGELVSVFSLAKGRGEQLVDDAILHKGAKKLDAFDIKGKLPKLYGKYMKETSRMKFADEYAPKEWDYNKVGRPDVVMMELDPKKLSEKKPEKMADGGEVPHFDQGGMAIPDSDVQMDAAPPQGGMQAGGIPDSDVELDSDKYGTGEQQVKTFLEGAAQGVAGPLATMAETGLGMSTKQDILGRQKENPWVYGIGQGAGLTGSLLTGVGEGAILAKSGEAAAGLAGLGQATSFAAKVGSSAVSQAAEMAVLQGGDEVSKMILQDPDSSVQTAIANVGMSAAMGGVGGGLLGTVNPLWKATAGPKVDEFLGTLRSHLNGTGALELPEAVAAAQKELGIPIENVMNSALSGNPTAAKHFNILRELDHPEILRQIENLKTNSERAIIDSLGIPLEDVAVSSDKDAGDRLKDTFLKEYNDIHEPVAARQEMKAETAKGIPISDDDNLAHYGRLIEKGMDKVGTDSPYYKLYNEYGNRLLAKGTIGEQDRIKSEILKKARTFGLDLNEKDALHDIAASIDGFHEGQIEKQSIRAEAEGAEHGAAIGRDINAERKAASAEYKQFAGMSQQLTDHLNIRDFSGAGGLKKAVAEVTPETLLKKFSPKGDVGAIDFLREHFPATLAEVQKNEAKRMLRTAVSSEGGQVSLNAKALAKTIERHMKEAPELVRFALPGRTVEKVQAAKVLQDALPDYSSSKTASWLSKLLSTVPASATAMIGALSHGTLGGVGGYAIGELMHRLGREVPDAARLGLLNFLSSDKPVKSEGMKAAVDMMHNVYKGDAVISKGVKNIFRAAPVLPESHIPNAASRLKLDRLVAQNQDNPNQQMQQASSGDLGHYLPQHQASAANITTSAQQYLSQLKPKPYQSSPLDKQIEPSAAQKARYDRALDIAQSPALVLQHVKQGTLQASDLVDLKSMYPSLYQSMAQKLTNEMGSQQSDESHIPYKTRLSISLFLGQPLDSTMSPASIMAAQPQPKGPPPAPPGQKMKGKGKSASSLNKLSNDYKTSGQSAEGDRSSRE